jgi:thymidylate synthase
MNTSNINNNKIVLDLFKEFKKLKDSNQFVIDKSGVKTVEMISLQFQLNPIDWKIDLGFKKTNVPYVKKELRWYLSQSRDIIGFVDDIVIWKQICSKENLVNSNYGYLIFSNANGSQFENCLNELIKNKETRKASMIYTRPSIHSDAYLDGMSDFICTNGVQVFIRNNELIYIIHQRSCDMVYGFFNDFTWHCFVYRKLYRKLKNIYSDLKIGDIIYNIDSAHIYEKHFKFLENIN